nr:MAG TPA: hypothetical protein [Caudoviricetes sp.]
MDTCFEGISTEVDSYVSRQWRNMEFCATIMEQNREMERFVNESIIMASGNKKAINEMNTYLNESTFTDKIKNFFIKIKNFFKKIFSKIAAALSGLFMEQKKYIDKYSGIITKCKWHGGDISDIKNRTVGIPRIINAVDNVDSAVIGVNLDKFFNGDPIQDDPKSFISKDIFSSAENIEKAEIPNKLENGAQRDKIFEEFTGQGTYWGNLKDFASYKVTDSNGNVDINKTFAAWFDGSTDTVTWSEDYVENNFQTIINASYAGKSYLARLQKIYNAVDKKMTEASKNMEDYYKAQSDKFMQAVKGNSTNAQTATDDTNTDQQGEAKAAAAVQKAEEDGKTKEAEVAKTPDSSEFKPDPLQPADNKQPETKSTDEETVSFAANFDMYLNETNFVNSSSSSSDPKGSVPAGTGNINNTSASNATDKVNSMTTKTGTAQSINNTTGNVTNDLQTKAQQILDADVHNRQVRINESVNISTSIAKNMLDSFENTNKDFFNIIKHHVQWYLSNPGAEKLSENTTTRSRSLNIDAGSEQVKTVDGQQSGVSSSSGSTENSGGESGSEGGSEQTTTQGDDEDTGGTPATKSGLFSKFKRGDKKKKKFKAKKK